MLLLTSSKSQVSRGAGLVLLHALHDQGLWSAEGWVSVVACITKDLGQ